MEVSPGRSSAATGAAFTLVELLLTVVVLLLLFGAILFNFSSLQQGAQLDEGATQLEALFRYARAYAANSGRTVQISFEEDAGEGFMVPLGNLQMLYQADPVNQPGYYTAVLEADNYVRGILDLIAIESVRSLTEDDSLPATNDLSFASGEEETMVVTFPPIFFYPDGTCDSVEIVISSRDEQDTRQMAVTLVGVTGALRRRIIEREVSDDEFLDEMLFESEPNAPSTR